MRLLRFITICLIALIGAVGIANLENDVKAENEKYLSFPAKDSDTQKLKDHINSIMAKIPTSPGVAVGVVKGDKTIFAEGFGYRNLREKLPVNAQTQFYLGSTTKAFTAATAKILAEEGKLDLDVPIKTYFPNLKMKAPLSEEQLTLRDLLTHRLGFTNNAISFRTAYTGQYNTDVIVKLLAKHSTPRSPAYSYTNLGYVLTGVAMEQVTKESWKKLTRDKLFDPIGMDNTTSYASKAIASGNYALPYRSDSGKFVELPYKNDSTMHPAGGTSSSAEDMAKWLTVMMNEGKYQGKQIISKRAMKEILSPQINQDRKFYRYNRYAYGLGWNIATYKGEEFIHCFGTYAGFRPHTSFMPEHNIGIVVLVNESTESVVLADLIANEIYDYLLGKRELNAEANPDIDEYESQLKKIRERAVSRTVNTSISSNQTSPKLSTDQYSGTYRSDEFGEVKISVKDSKLVADWGTLSANLVFEKDNLFKADFMLFRPMNAVFGVNSNNEIQDLMLDEDKYSKVK